MPSSIALRARRSSDWVWTTTGRHLRVIWPACSTLTRSGRSGRASSSRSSDAAEVNVRAIRFLAWEVQDEKRSLPDKVREYLLPFTIADNVVLCLAHGLSRTVVDGLAAAGAHVTMVNKDQFKVIRPSIIIDVTEVGGSVIPTDVEQDLARIDIQRANGRALRRARGGGL
ncbi:hypothetical protein OC835_003319 [Tilletia horrida]|uniref:Uncharacterized protein n=1 Tax=Tilletia horrida TaxID=155126 RepID=A0AAN6JGU8_9BASI|nr:hypothetical protein OC842_007510 [Tilletia horrida]KAK0532490.1 hypothetical protein OC835_003319 [Tilletia horrida]KAK0552100.1 hypothetical protein OC844_006485 [Tilletia horrida]